MMRVTAVFVVGAALSPGLLEWSLHGRGGHMQHMISPDGCADRSGEVRFGGLAGELRLIAPGKGGDWNHGAQVHVRAELRSGRFQGMPKEAGTDRVRVGYGTLTVGWHSRYLGARIGVYGGNTGENGEELAFIAGSVRVGTPKGNLRFGILDQPACYPADCLVGLALDFHYVTGGLSGGLTAGRFFAQGRIPVGEYEIQPAIFAGTKSEYGFGRNLVFSLGVGGRWGTAGGSAPPRLHRGPPGLGL